MRISRKSNIQFANQTKRPHQIFVSNKRKIQNPRGMEGGNRLRGKDLEENRNRGRIILYG
ncbi:hypothetical protein Scep_017273 [Stephania cephalantha]|uniref:Uncharacterized protein n=1 Tax=Stephania cephalantha TaxID=152367 RepID=A0AAP0IPR5_9MAGN